MYDENVLSMLNRIRCGSVLVIGDAIIDCYVQGTQQRFSSEAPISIFDIQEISFRLGGAANVVNNLLSAGQKVDFCSIVGDDYLGDKLIQLLKQSNCNYLELITEPGRKTTTKIRYRSENGTQVFRSDYEDTYDIRSETKQSLLQFVGKNINKYDLILLSDYQKGCLSQDIISSIVRLAHILHIPVWADSKSSNASKYYGCDLIKPNKREFFNMVRWTGESSIDLIGERANFLCKKNSNENIVVTLGAEGMLCVDITQGVEYIPGIKVACNDVSGAGDTAFSYLAVGKLSGLSIIDSAKLANVAAGISVRKCGVTTISVCDIRFNICKKVSWKNVVPLTKYLEKKKVVFTNGCFDILHFGHIHSLRQAAKLGDVLVVGINTDDSVSRIKGKNRPIKSLYDRMEVLEALECVDYIIPFDEDTPFELIRLLHPDVLVKGKDYSGKYIVEAEFVQSYGGKVVLVEYLDGYSTTKTVNRICGLENSTNGTEAND